MICFLLLITALTDIFAEEALFIPLIWMESQFCSVQLAHIVTKTIYQLEILTRQSQPKNHAQSIITIQWRANLRVCHVRLASHAKGRKLYSQIPVPKVPTVHFMPVFKMSCLALEVLTVRTTILNQLISVIIVQLVSIVRLVLRNSLVIVTKDIFALEANPHQLHQEHSTLAHTQIVCLESALKVITVRWVLLIRFHVPQAISKMSWEATFAILVRRARFVRIQDWLVQQQPARQATSAYRPRSMKSPMTSRREEFVRVDIFASVV